MSAPRVSSSPSPAFVARESSAPWIEVARSPAFDDLALERATRARKERRERVERDAKAFGERARLRREEREAQITLAALALDVLRQTLRAERALGLEVLCGFGTVRHARG